VDLSRRELLAASAALLASPKAALSGVNQAGVGQAGESQPAAAAAEASAGAGAAAAPSTGAGAGAKPIVLCWNENPYGPSPAARAIINGTIPGSCRYPDEEINQLVEVLAHTEGVPADNIVVGTGSGELLCALGLLHGRNGGEIIAAGPTYEELTNYATHAGAEVKFVPVDKQLNHDLTAMRAAVSERTHAIYICNPNNPTGTAISASSIRSFVQSVPESVTTIVDEAYLDFADSSDVRTVSDLVSGRKRVVVLRTFSKIHGMAGVGAVMGLRGPMLRRRLRLRG